MTEKVKIGIVKETKCPPDKRVPLIPSQIAELKVQYPNVEVFIQPSKIRGYKDEEFYKNDIKLQDDLSHCDILIGVKEIKPKALIENKTYMFFAHVAKEQAHNRKLLQEIIKKNITLIDYEYLTNDKGKRVVAYGHWAGVVGAYNGLRAYGMRSGKFNLEQAYSLKTMDRMYVELKKVNFNHTKILLTGGGRVAKGALQTLGQLNIKEVTPEDFLTKEFNEPVLCRLDPVHYVKHKSNPEFELKDFYKNPKEYDSIFKKYTKVADVYMACHYWDTKSPKFINKEDYLDPEFNIKVIADISCDVGGPIDSTLRPTKITDPFYDYNPLTGEEAEPFSDSKNVTVMSVDSLPGELPRNSSEDFGGKLLNIVLPSLLGEDKAMIERATIVKNGKLTERFSYLQDFVDEKE